MNAKEQAVQTAGSRLEHIEMYARRVFIAVVVCALCLAAIAGMIGSLAVDYVNAKRAMAEASRKMSEDMRTRFPITNKGGLR